MKKSRTAEKGFTLLELIITSSVLLLSALAVLGAYTMLNTTAIFSAQRTQATQDALLVMETIRVRQRTSHVALPSTSVTLAPDGSEWEVWVNTVIRPGSGVRLPNQDIIASYVPSVPGTLSNVNGLQKVEVTVTWLGPGSPRVRLVSFFAVRPTGT